MKWSGHTENRRTLHSSLAGFPCTITVDNRGPAYFLTCDGLQVVSCLLEGAEDEEKACELADAMLRSRIPDVLRALALALEPPGGKRPVMVLLASPQDDVKVPAGKTPRGMFLTALRSGLGGSAQTFFSYLRNYVGVPVKIEVVR